MIISVIGEPNSGKSEIAEAKCLELAGEGVRVYLATMLVVDDESRERVKRHRKRRQGKGFITIEAPYKLAEAVSKMDRSNTVESRMTELPDSPKVVATPLIPAESTALVECVSNLIANEMFEWNIKNPEQLFTVIKKELVGVARLFKHVVFVSNRFAKTGDEETDNYITMNNQVNRFLQEFSDETVLVSRSSVNMES